MLVKITRGRFGWQKPGCAFIQAVGPSDGPIDVPEATAKRLVEQGVAEYVTPAPVKKSAPKAKPAEPKAQPKTEQKAEPAADAPAYSEEMTRSELNALAAKAGIKGAAKMPNKAAVIAALDKRYGRV